MVPIIGKIIGTILSPEFGTVVIIFSLLLVISNMSSLENQYTELYRQTCMESLDSYVPLVLKCASKETCKDKIKEYFLDDKRFEYYGEMNARSFIEEFIDKHASGILYVNNLKKYLEKKAAMCQHEKFSDVENVYRNIIINFTLSTAIPYNLFKFDNSPARKYLKRVIENLKRDKVSNEDGEFYNIYIEAKNSLDALEKEYEKDESFASIANRYFHFIEKETSAKLGHNPKERIFSLYRQISSQHNAEKEIFRTIEQIANEMNPNEFISQVLGLKDFEKIGNIISKLIYGFINKKAKNALELKNNFNIISLINNLNSYELMHKLEDVAGKKQSSAVTKFYQFIKKEIQLRKKAEERCKSLLTRSNNGIGPYINARINKLFSINVQISDYAKFFDSETLNVLRRAAKRPKSTEIKDNISIAKMKEVTKSRLLTLKKKYRKIKITPEDCSKIGLGEGFLRKYMELEKISNELDDIKESLEWFDEEWANTIKLCNDAAKNVMKEINLLGADMLNKNVEELLINADRFLETENMNYCKNIATNYKFFEKFKSNINFKEEWEKCNKDLQNLINFLEKNNIEIASFAEDENYEDFKDAYFKCVEQKKEILSALTNTEGYQQILTLIEEIRELIRKIKVIDDVPKDIEEWIENIEANYFDESGLLKIQKIDEEVGIREFINELQNKKEILEEMLNDAIAEYIKNNANVWLEVAEMPIEGKEINAIMHIYIENPFTEHIVLRNSVSLCPKLSRKDKKLINDEVCVSISALPFEKEMNVKGIVVETKLKSLSIEIIGNDVRVKKILLMPSLLDSLPGLRIFSDGEIKMAYCDNKLINFSNDSNKSYIDVKPECEELTLVYEYKDSIEMSIKEKKSNIMEEIVEKEFEIHVSNKTGLILENVLLNVSLPFDEIEDAEVYSLQGERLSYSKVNNKIVIALDRLEKETSLILKTKFKDINGFIEREKERLKNELLGLNVPKPLVQIFDGLIDVIEKAKTIEEILKLENDVEEFKKEVESMQNYKLLYINKRDEINYMLEALQDSLDVETVENVLALLDEAERLFKDEKYREAYEIINDIKITIPESKRKEMESQKEEIEKEREKIEKIKKLLNINWKDSFNMFEREYNDAITWNDMQTAQENLENMEKEVKRQKNMLAEECTRRLNSLRKKIKNLKSYLPVIKALVLKFVKALSKKYAIKSYAPNITYTWLNTQKESIKLWEKEIKNIEKKVSYLEKYLDKEDIEKFSKEIRKLDIVELENNILSTKEKLENENSKLKTHAQILLLKAKDYAEKNNIKTDALSIAQQKMAQEDYFGAIEVAEKILSTKQSVADFDIPIVYPFALAALLGTIFVWKKRREKLEDINIEFEELN